MYTIEAKTRDDDKVWIVGKGMMLFVGHMTPEQVAAFKNMSPSARKQFVNEYIQKYPEAFKQTAGYCRVQQKHVKASECVACARQKGWIKLAQWDVCRSHNLSGVGGAL